MRKHCERGYPHESCGVFVGRLQDGERIVNGMVPCANSIERSAERRYKIAPEELIAAQKKARDLGADIVGFYHSHPNASARWSATDLEEAHWFACSYVIVSVEAGIAGRTSSYVLAGTGDEDKRFDDEILRVL